MKEIVYLDDDKIKNEIGCTIEISEGVTRSYIGMTLPEEETLFLPSEARKIAAALVKAADEIEGVK